MRTREERGRPIVATDEEGSPFHRPVPRDPPGGSGAEPSVPKLSACPAAPGLGCIPPGQGRAGKGGRAESSVGLVVVEHTTGEWLITRMTSRENET